MAARFFKSYNQALLARPLLVQSSTAAVLYAVGDVIAQKVSSASDSEHKPKHDWHRTIMMTGIGGCALGPCMAFWYRFLQRSINLKSHGASVLARVFVDQAVFAPVSIVGLYGLVELLQPTTDPVSERLEKAKDKLDESFTTVLMRNYMLWPGVQYLNFFYIPLRYRLLVSNTVAIFWSAFLSATVNDSKKKEIELPVLETIH